MTLWVYLGPGAPGGAGGLRNGAPQPVLIVVHIAARSIMLNNLFFIAVNVYRYNMSKKGFVCKHNKLTIVMLRNEASINRLYSIEILRYAQNDSTG